MKKRFWVPILALMSSLMFSITAFAGDINSAEQKILDAISGTYEYNGAYYKVTDAYIAKVSTYLSSDDIDMTETEANSYVAQFNANIAVGVTNGYMEKVGDIEDSNPTDGTDGSNNDNNSNSNGNNNSNNNNTDNSNNSGNNNGNNSNNNNSGNSNSDNNINSNNNGNNNSGDSNRGNGSNNNTGNNSSNGNNNDGNNSNTDNNINSGTDNALSGFFTDSESADGVVEDNTLGSTTDGEIAYTVFPIDKQTMYAWGMDTDTLEVHAEAYKDSEVIGTLNKGDAVTILGAATTGWAQIEFGDTVGYVSAVYLRTQGFMDNMQEEVEGGEGHIGAKDYSDAAPLSKSMNLGVIALVIVLIVAIVAGGLILWHKNKNKIRNR